jgi:hypothetical protein
MRYVMLTAGRLNTPKRAELFTDSSKVKVVIRPPTYNEQSFLLWLLPLRDISYKVPPFSHLLFLLINVVNIHSV